MSNNPQFRNHLRLAYASYMQLDDVEQRAALETTVALLRTMLRNGSGQRQQLASGPGKPPEATEEVVMAIADHESGGVGYTDVRYFCQVGGLDSPYLWVGYVGYYP